VSERTAVYRLFASDAALLYIGVAKDFGVRWKRHAHAQPWWSEVQRQTVDWYPDRELALAVEKDAIRSERPLYNVIHASSVPAEASAELHELALRNYQDKQSVAASSEALVDAILEAHDEGWRQVDIVRAVELTRERVRQICDPRYRKKRTEGRASRRA
jgi:hypothetical protein